MTATTIPPPKPLDVEILTTPEIADLAGVAKQTAEHWRFRHKASDDPKSDDKPKLPPFPEPDDHIGFWPIWRLERVTAWLDATSRKYDVDAWRTKRAAGGYRRLGGK